jgi:hypothetical protein
MRKLVLVLAILALATSVSAQPITTAANAAFGVVSTTYDASATSIVLSSGHGARFGSTFPVRAVWYNATDYPGGVDSTGTVDPNIEWIEITARATDTLTVTRAIEGPAASTKNTGGKTYWIVAVPVTAASWNAVLASLGASPQALKTTSSPTFGGLTVDTDTFCVDATNNRLGIGTCAPDFAVHAIANATNIWAFDTYSSNSAFRFRSGNGTSSAITRKASSEGLGALQWWGAAKDDGLSGATFITGNATLRVMTREAFTTTGRGTQFEFQPTAVGSTSVATAATLSSDALGLAAGVDLTLAAGSEVQHASEYVSRGTTGFTLYPGGTSTNNTDHQIRWSGANNAGGGTTSNQIIQLFRNRIDGSTNYFNPVIRWAPTDGTNNGADVGEFGVEGNWTNAGGYTLRRIYLWDFVRNSGAGGTIWRWEDSQPGQFNIGGDDLDMNLHVDQGHYIAKSYSNTAGTGTSVDLYRFRNAIASDPDRARSGDVLGRVRAFGGEGATDTATATTPTAASAELRFDAAASHTTSDHAAQTVIATAGSGSTTLTDRFKVDYTGTQILESLSLSGDNQPAQIAANTNDYAISSTAAVTVVDADQIRTITGMTGGIDGRQHTIINDGASDSVIILRHDDTGSTAANRFTMPNDVVLEPGQPATFWYNSTASRWQLLATPSNNRTVYLPFEDNDLLNTASADTKEATETWNYAVISSGTQAKVAADGTHRGILRTLSSTTTNSGGVMNTAVDSFRLAGGEYTEFVFNVDTTTNTTIRMGFLDTATSADATDGAYIEIPASTAPTCKTANNSTRTTSATIATIATATWYRARIEVDNTAANVTCTIFDANGNSLGSQTNSANIPTAAGRETGHGYVATNSGTTAVNLIQMDYMSVGTRRAIIR